LKKRMTKLASLGALAASTLAFVATASANTVAVDGGNGTIRYIEREPEVPGPRRVEGRFGMLLGGSDVGDADGFSMGVSAALGYRVGDVTLRGLFDYFRVGDGGDEALDRRGRSTRAGGALRYSFANTGDEEGAGADFWGEVGLGYEHVAWRAGGVLDRPSGELAIGFDLDSAGKDRSPGRRRHLGYFMAFRTLLAQGPDMDGPAMCGGPCDKATKPSRIDASMFFELGMHWGR
jgi:hypothetical protein